MSAQIIDGKALAAATKAEAAAEAAALKAKGIEPCLAVILVGENPASQVYVRGKVKDCGECGIKSLELRMPESSVSSNAPTCSTRMFSPNAAPNTTPPLRITSRANSVNTPPDEDCLRSASSFACAPSSRA